MSATIRVVNTFVSSNDYIGCACLWAFEIFQITQYSVVTYGHQVVHYRIILFISWSLCPFTNISPFPPPSHPNPYPGSHKSSPCFFEFFFWGKVFKNVLLNLLGWHWLIKLYRVQVYNSIIRHLYIILCGFFLFHT